MTHEDRCHKGAQRSRLGVHGGSALGFIQFEDNHGPPVGADCLSSSPRPQGCLIDGGPLFTTPVGSYPPPGFGHASWVHASLDCITIPLV